MVVPTTMMLATARTVRRDVHVRRVVHRPVRPRAGNATRCLRRGRGLLLWEDVVVLGTSAEEDGERHDPDGDDEHAEPDQPRRAAQAGGRRGAGCENSHHRLGTKRYTVLSARASYPPNILP
jgi:hypothetical protein